MAIVIAYVRVGKDLKFLIGKESVYLRDSIGKDVIKPHEEYAFPPDAKLNQLHDYFSAKAIEMTTEFDEFVQYDNPKKYSDGIARVKFRILPDKFKYGVIKGGIEDSDKGNLKLTAAREFSEEFFAIPVYPENLIDSGKDVDGRRVFFLNLTPLVNTIPTAIASRKKRHHGELFDTGLYTYEQVCSMWPRMNNSSRLALNIFFVNSKLPPCRFSKPTQ